MGLSSRECLSIWKGYVYRREYQELVFEVAAVARLFYKTNDREWIKVFKDLYKEINGLTKHRIWHNIREYLKDFILEAIKTVKGECGKVKFRNKEKQTHERLARPYLN